MQSTKRLVVILFLFTQSMHGTEQTIEAYVIFSKEQGGGIVCRVALL
jgi:hypothetical protein